MAERKVDPGTALLQLGIVLLLAGVILWVAIEVAGASPSAKLPAIVGDSLTAQADPYFPDSWVVDGLGLRPMEGSAQLVADTAQGRDRIVVALGTNDVALEAFAPSGQVPEDRWYAAIQQVKGRLNAAGNKACRVFVNVRNAGTTYGETFESLATRFNTLLRASVEHVVNWAWHSRNHPEWFGPDGLHFTDAGAAEYARFIRTVSFRACS